MVYLSETLFGARQKPRDPRIERLIAIARVALIVLALIALAIDPLEPPATNARIFFILAVYLGLSLIFAVIGFAGWRPSAWKVATHVADVGMAALLIDISALSVSPFFSYFLFVLLAATLRWDARGAIWTTAGAFTLFVAIVWMRTPPLDQLHTDPTSPINRAFVQGTFLIVAGALLAFFGRLNERNRDRLAQLAAWPAAVVKGSGAAADAPLAPILQHAAAVMRVPRIVVLWEEAEAPDIRIASWTNGRYDEIRTLDPALIDSFNTMVAPELASVAFAVNDVRTNNCITPDGVRLSKDAAADPGLVTRFAIGAAATARFMGTVCSGRVFLLDRMNWRVDDLMLTEIVAAHIGTELEQRVLRRQVEEFAAVRERARLARDLHDGILQNFTAVRLRLANAEARAGDEARDLLHSAGQVLMEEQRRIRDFVDATRSPATPGAAQNFALRAETEQLLRKARETWGCHVDLAVSPPGATVSGAIGREVAFLLTEALANAIQHGRATSIDVALERLPDKLNVCIRNNGQPIGATFGSFDLQRLEELGLGPRTVRERIAALGGSLILTNSLEGIDMQMALPLS